MLLEDNAHQLAARTDSSLGEKLLKRGFYRTLGHADSRCDLFVCESFKYAGQHLSLPLGKGPRSWVGDGRGVGPESSLQLFMVEPHLARHHVTNGLRQ